MTDKRSSKVLVHERVKSVLLIIKLKLPEILQKPTHGKPFHLYVGSRDQTQVVGLAWQAFYVLSHLTSPALSFLIE